MTMGKFKKYFIATAILLCVCLFVFQIQLTGLNNQIDSANDSVEYYKGIINLYESGNDSVYSSLTLPTKHPKQSTFVLEYWSNGYPLRVFGSAKSFTQINHHPINVFGIILNPDSTVYKIISE
jgi:hypothetical protein